MVGVARHNVRDPDKMSDRWSSGTIYHPSSQSRKISIGLMVNSSGKQRLGASKADEVAIPNEERIKYVVENATEVKTRVEGIAAGTKGKKTETPLQASSPSVTKRSSYRKESAPETSLCAKQDFTIPSSSGRQNKQQGGEDVPPTHSVHVEELTSATAKEVLFPGKAVAETITDKTENRCSGTLKMKLWEILGNASSAKDHGPQSHSLKVDMNHSKPAENLGRMRETVAKYRQNSDTIETDSENPNHSIGKPETRSLSRKRAPTKVYPKRVNDKAPSICKQKHQENNIFSFVEGGSGRLNDDNSGGSSRSTRKCSERQRSRTGLQKICHPENDYAGKIQQKTHASEVAAPDEKSSSLGIIRSLRSCPLDGDKYQPKNDIQEKSPCNSPMATKTDKGNVDSPKLSGNKDQQEWFTNASSKNAVDPDVDYQSSAFGMKTPTPDSSPSAVPESNQMGQGVCSPAPEEREFTAGDVPSFKTWGTSKQNCYGSNVQKKSSEDVQETKTSPCIKSASVLEEKNADDGMAESSSEEGNSESSEEGFSERIASPPNAGTAVRPKVTLKSIKRLRNYEDILFKELSSTPPSPKGAAGSDWMQEPPEQTQEDELARAVTLFAMALKGLKSKIKSAAGKKSSEVLMSVAEGIHLQLENIEAQIQTDTEKMASVSKSKRRRLETKFQEQQEQLNLIHEKFKEEVNQHLQECRETLLGLEAHQIEVKGTTEKQRASHRKLLLQVDEAIEMQLNDAQRRITAINKLARGQMLQLKCVMTKCLKEGILN